MYNTKLEINDYTFATRLKSFIANVQVNDAMSDEEREYLIRHADKLLEQQINNSKDKDELEYLERCHPKNKDVKNALKQINAI